MHDWKWTGMGWRDQDPAEPRLNSSVHNVALLYWEGKVGLALRQQ